MMAIIQEDENSNTSRRRVMESSEFNFQLHMYLHYIQFNVRLCVSCRFFFQG
jgi:hypothetical protein